MNIWIERPRTTFSLMLAPTLLLAACGSESSDPMTMTGDSAVLQDASLMLEDAAVPQDDSSVPEEDASVEQDAAEDGGGNVIGPGKTCPDGLELERGECVETCKTLGIEELDCGVGGFCGRSVANKEVPYCYCDDGYEGANCETCETGFALADDGTCQLTSPPDDMRLWLDADTSWTVNKKDGKVDAWGDRRANVTAWATAPSVGAKPTYLPNYRNGRDALEFDGTDDHFMLEGFTHLSSNDFEIVIAGEPRDNVTGVVGATNVENPTDWAFMMNRIPHTDNFHMIIRDPAAASGGTTTVVERERALQPMFLIGGRQTSTAYDSLVVIASDTTDSQAYKSYLYPEQKNILDYPLDLHIGRTQVGAFKGVMYEVIVYDRRLTVAERKQVTDYLRGKWNLP